MVLSSAALAGCTPETTDVPAAIQLLEFSQAESRGVRLNETLRFTFSGPLDRTSITGSSFVVQDATGELASGRVIQRASTLQFEPALPLRPDLSDGGLLPGRTYTVRLLGFPAPDGVRGLEGEPLTQSHVFQFKTAGAGGDEAVFVPPISGPLPLVFDCRQRIVAPLEPIQLETVEGIDPRSLNDELFVLVPASAPTVDASLALPLRARLTTNRADRAVVVLEHVADRARPDRLAALTPGEYWLIENTEAERFRTLGGVPVPPLWVASGQLFHPLRVGDSELGSLREEFEGQTGGSPIPVEGVDGTAILGADGAVQVRFPRAAGGGAAGSVVLTEAPPLDASPGSSVLDLPATHLRVPSGARVDLGGRTGAVVLRSQRALEIEGELVRRGAPAGPTIRDWIEERQDALRAAEVALHEGRDGSEQELLERRRRVEEARGQLTLSAIVDAALAGDFPWTILVAGGDVRVPGSIDVDGELLIAAGGWVRVGGRVSARTAWTTPEGGGDFGVVQDVPSPLPLEIDPPVPNPLREPLTVAVATRPLRPTSALRSWGALKTFGDEGTGRILVRALGLRRVGAREIEELGPVEDLGVLDGCDSLRLVVELRVDPARPPDGEPAPWDPPRLEAVEVTWKRARPGEQEPIGARGGGGSGR